MLSHYTTFSVRKIGGPRTFSHKTESPRTFETTGQFYYITQISASLNLQVLALSEQNGKSYGNCKHVYKLHHLLLVYMNKAVAIFNETRK